DSAQVNNSLGAGNMATMKGIPLFRPKNKSQAMLSGPHVPDQKRSVSRLHRFVMKTEGLHRRTMAYQIVNDERSPVLGTVFRRKLKAVKNWPMAIRNRPQPNRPVAVVKTNAQAIMRDRGLDQI